MSESGGSSLLEAVSGKTLLLKIALRLGGGTILGAFAATSLISAAFFILLLQVCASEGSTTLLETNGGRGLLEHYGTLSNFLAIPLLITLALVLVSRVADIYRSNSFFDDEEGRPLLSPQDHKDMTAILQRHSVASRLLYYFLYYAAMAFLALNIAKTAQPVGFYGQEVWDSTSYPYGYLLGRLLLIFLWVTVIPPVIYLSMASGYIIYRLTVKFARMGVGAVQPFSPDRCGGFRPLGRVMMAVFYVFLTMFAILFAHYLTHSRTYETLILSFVVYAVALVAILVLPLWKLHELLAAAKEQYLARIMRVIRTQGERLEYLTSGHSPAPLAIVASCQLHTHAEQMSTWPYLLKDKLQWLLPLALFGAEISLKLL